MLPAIILFAVTYVLMIAPVAMAVCKKLNTNPVPVIISISVSSNLQGAATLVGDTTANIAGMGILRKEGYEVRNADFFKIGIPFTLAAIVPAYIYIWLIYGV